PDSDQPARAGDPGRGHVQQRLHLPRPRSGAGGRAGGSCADLSPRAGRALAAAAGPPLAPCARAPHGDRHHAPARSRAARAGSVHAPATRAACRRIAAAGLGAAVGLLLHGRARPGAAKQATPATAAAILLAVNVSAVLPATPSNVGVFQAACLVVLAAYGVGAGPGLAYGIILQAVEVVTALALGAPALLAEGLTWRDIRAAGAEASDAETP